ncbi:hypothetical protein F66182_201 [Fusarium sp. NRRL 66182]|nr:hypothetical protein F66182_201 [Fusarium sp. NRRL 66182]
MLLIPFTLEIFLLFKTASYMSYLSPWTKRSNRFFYQDRGSAMVLPILSIPWLVSALLIGGIAFVNVVAGGSPLGNILNFLGIFAALFFWAGVLYYIPLVGWVVWAGVEALLRVIRLKSPEEEEAFNIDIQR